MGKLRKFDELEVEFDPEHEKREWIVQRFGWATMGILVIATLIGLLGSGPLSDATAGKPGDRLRIEYHRFGRYQAPGELRVYCRPDGKDFELSFDRGFFEKSEVSEISPEPEEMRTEGDKYVYRFRSGEGEEHLVTFRFEAAQFGKAKSKVTLDRSEKREIQTFYWP